MRALILFSLLVLAGCSNSLKSSSQLSVIHLTDRNGVKETIDSEDRLATFDHRDFEKPQPYEKVVRVFKKNKSILTSYHPNGQLKQYLEAQDARANGTYCEWFDNGVLHMQTSVIEGIADLSERAQETWKFDGLSNVFDEDGALIAQFTYEMGRLEKEGRYFYPSGALKQTLPYHLDQLEGEVLEYREDQSLLGKTSYKKGLKDGSAFYLGNETIPPFEEEYKKGKLIEGKYEDFDHTLLSSIKNGNGFQSIFFDGELERQVEYRKGIANGIVRQFRPNKELANVYCVEEGKKHGEEWLYYDNQHPKLLITWYKDEIHGITKAWHENGTLMSQREMAHNQKQGLSSAWYESGDRMFVEEYQNDQLISGKYYKKGSKAPISQIDKGTGFATLYDPKGVFLRKVKYIKGRPHEPK